MRANIAAGLMLVCGGSILLAGSRPPRPGVDWPQFRGDFAHGQPKGSPRPCRVERSAEQERAAGRHGCRASACRAR